MGFYYARARLGLGCCLAVAAAVALLPHHVVAGDASASSQTLALSELQGPLLVEATAYNSVGGQTEGDPEIGAWGDRLDPGVRSVAVSNDLVELGLKRGTRVRIEGLAGEFLVLDRMPPQWQRRIDIHMGESVDVAKQWGRRKVRIYWQTP
jgi:3D (Asp-Asp-Asp) domain-containing protein